ncbi:uncharacterized protein LOC107718576 isoform X5 [Sinocyclocheilus rhinocerous]|uniref:uncharacterized protein LOC107718576 isoform X5 n=1 Tax=Sinocyclocheilus rhinocerous TaxID=307959 RepID=UPI0007B8C66A|nr:PREDICTED: uncharacterized protein LOC107718576 isoform X5 [Sinocyclocheilus rhinocerous]
MTAYARVTVRGLKPPQRSEVLELLKRYSVKFWDAFDLGGKMMAARFALCVHVARATTRSSTRILGHEHARSLSSDTDFSGIKERTLVAVKPDGVQRRLIGEVIKRFEQRGFRLVGLKMLPVWEGHNVVRSSRMLVGSTDPAEAAPGTIRGDFSVHISSHHEGPWLEAKLDLKIKITTQTHRYSQEHPFIQSVKGAALTCFSYYGKETVINTCISP